VWPDSVEAQRSVRQSKWGYFIEETSLQVVKGPGSEAAEEIRCSLDAEISRYAFIYPYVEAYRAAFVEAWDREFCATRLMPPAAVPVETGES
jgi:hypothetical protein